MAGLANVKQAELKLLQCLQEVDWEAMDRWAEYARTINGQDPQCDKFRVHMSRLLWERAADVGFLFLSRPTRGLDVDEDGLSLWRWQRAMAVF